MSPRPWASERSGQGQSRGPAVLGQGDVSEGFSNALVRVGISSTKNEMSVDVVLPTIYTMAHAMLQVLCS